MLLSRAAALGLVVLAVGCSDDQHGTDGGGGDGGGDGGGGDGDGPQTCTIGDRSQPIEVAPLTAGFDGQFVDLTDGATVELLRPIQGGMVIYAGVKARNVDGCNVLLTGALRDTSSNLVIALEQRPVSLVAGADGWGMPVTAFYSMANVPACPNAVTAVDLDQGTWRLELRLDEVGGRTAALALDVSPRCLQLDQRVDCECECDSDYELGQPCPVDP